MRKTLFLVLVGMLLSLSVPVASGALQEISPNSDDLGSKLRFAAGQHEIIGILLEQGSFSEILIEYRQILELELRGENEVPVVKEAWYLVEQLRQSEQYSLAHAVVDESLEWFQNRESTFYLLIMRGKIFHDEAEPKRPLTPTVRPRNFRTKS